MSTKKIRGNKLSAGMTMTSLSILEGQLQAMQRRLANLGDEASASYRNAMHARIDQLLDQWRVERERLASKTDSH